MTNVTFLSFENRLTSPNGTIYDSIAEGDFELFNLANNFSYLPVFENTIFVKNRLKPKFNGVEIPINWTTEENWIQDFKDSLYAFAGTLTNETHRNYLKLCADNVIGSGSVFYDDTAGNVRLFNAYDAQDNPTDYTLNMQNGNPALFSSREKDYCGAYRPNLIFEWDLENIQNIDADGNELPDPADLLISNGGIFANVNSNQIRNRIYSKTVIRFPNGDGFSRCQANFISSAANGWYLGMWQAPDANIIPLDSLELETYDTIDQQSEYPDISIPLNKDCEISYHKTGDKAGSPVLFNDLADLGIATNKNLTEYGNWAVTNAASECVNLYANVNTENRKLLFKYIKPVLTLNRTQAE